MPHPTLFLMMPQSAALLYIVCVFMASMCVEGMEKKRHQNTLCKLCSTCNIPDPSAPWMQASGSKNKLEKYIYKSGKTLEVCE